jgi:hypothetical protein
MLTKLHFNSVLAGNFPMPFPRSIQQASTIPSDEELRRSAEELARAAEKIEREREEMQRGTFGQQMRAAITARLRGRRPPRVTAMAPTAIAPTAEESFAEKLKREVEKRSGRKEREERLKRERERYHNRPRPHTKSD